ncbi:MAG: DUF3575 domain-containing protein [Proteiniphilum sp.]|nr:DUF3575 domain-containing protein [Proteiniphilum sp.]
MKKFTITSMVLFLLVLGVQAQSVGLKTNFAHWATMATPNLGIEMALNRKYTIEVGAGYNPFTFNNNKKFKHWIVQPELRYWTCESFNGHFFGIHALGAEFNVGGLDVPLGRLKDIKDYRYEGYAFGGGISYGYQWPIAKRLNLELNIGAGYAYLLYDKYKCVKCGEKQESDVKDNYFGVTKAAVSLIYFIK